MDSFTAAITKSVTENIKSIIIPVIVKYVNERETKEKTIGSADEADASTSLTVEELLSVLSINTAPSHAKLVKSPSPSLKSCSKEFKSKTKTGQTKCQKPALPDSPFCKIHSKTEAKAELLNNANIPNMSVAPIQNFSCEMFDEERSIYHDLVNHYLIKKYDEDIIKFVGKLGTDGSMLKLTEEECANLINKKLDVDMDYDL